MGLCGLDWLSRQAGLQEDAVGSRLQGVRPAACSLLVYIIRFIGDFVVFDMFTCSLSNAPVTLQLGRCTVITPTDYEGAAACTLPMVGWTICVTTCVYLYNVCYSANGGLEI